MAPSTYLEHHFSSHCHSIPLMMISLYRCKSSSKAISPNMKLKWLHWSLKSRTQNRLQTSLTYLGLGNACSKPSDYSACSFEFKASLSLSFRVKGYAYWPLFDDHVLSLFQLSSSLFSVWSYAVGTDCDIHHWLTWLHITEAPSQQTYFINFLFSRWALCEKLVADYATYSDLKAHLGVGKSLEPNMMNIDQLSNRNLYQYKKSLVRSVPSIFVASLVALIILSPVFPIIALTITSTSRGPVLYRQLRVGKSTPER